jgi:hypothetical protein
MSHDPAVMRYVEHLKERERVRLRHLEQDRRNGKYRWVWEYRMVDITDG